MQSTALGQSVSQVCGGHCCALAILLRSLGEEVREQKEDFKARMVLTPHCTFFPGKYCIKTRKKFISIIALQNLKKKTVIFLIISHCFYWFLLFRSKLYAFDLIHFKKGRYTNFCYYYFCY